jgi:site-specific DNA-methyltransferase (adenine-specific)
MGDSVLDMTITSPPYDNLRTYNEFSFDAEKIITELYRTTKEGGVVVWVVGDATIKGSETGTSFRQALLFMDKGFRLHDTMIYQKTGTPFPSKVRYNQCFEYMFVFSKGKPKTFNPIMKPNKTAGAVRHTRKYRNKKGELIAGFNGKPVNEMGIENNVWVIKNGMYKSTHDKIAFEHPAIFPEELCEKHIKSWSSEGDIVFDPFMGSGTTAKMAMLNNRNYVGSEISKEYCDVAYQRLLSIEGLEDIESSVEAS